MRSFLNSPFRPLIQIAIYAVGFLVPWNHWLHLDGDQNTWLLLASLFSRSASLGFSTSTETLLVVAIAFSTAGAALRSWASASSERPIARGTTTTDRGAYRSFRHPKSLGTVLSALSLSILMPLSGACLCLVSTLLWQGILIRNKEATAKQSRGNESRADEQFVLTTPPGVPDGGTPRRRWGRAMVSEVFTWGVAISFSILGWRYNALLIGQGVIVSLGAALVGQALVPRGAPATPVASRKG